MGDTRTLSFRTDDGLDAALAEFAADQGVPKSAAIRFLLRAGLGEETRRNATIEAIFAFQRFQHKVVRSLAAELQERMPAIIDREMNLE
jgi:predicted transcriptional regulator